MSVLRGLSRVKGAPSAIMIPKFERQTLDPGSLRLSEIGSLAVEGSPAFVARVGELVEIFRAELGRAGIELSAPKSGELSRGAPTLVLDPRPSPSSRTQVT